MASRYTLPSDNVAPNATWSVVSGAGATGYPVANVADRNPAKPFKATGTSVTIRATFGAPVVLKAVGLANHNVAGASVVKITSGAGLDQAIAVAANSGGQCVNPITDFSSASSGQRTSTTFDVVVATGVLGNIAIGEVLLLTEIRDLPWSWGVRIKPVRLVKRQTTFGGTHLQYNKRILAHRFSANIELQDDENAMRLLEMEAQGEVFPWVLWPDTTVNRWHLVQFEPGTFEWVWAMPAFTTIPIEALELSMGPPLFP